MTTFDIDAVLAAVNARAMGRGERLFPYQEDGARWLAGKRVALLADAMGVGKTWELVAATPPRSAVLVTCPSSVKYAWAKTYRFLRPEFAVRVIESRRDWRMPAPGQVLVCNYEVLPPSGEELDAAICEVADAIGASPPAGRPMDPATRERFVKSLVEAGAPRAAPGRWRKVNQVVQARRVLKVPFPGTVLIEDEAHRGKNPEAAVTGRLRQLRDMLRTVADFRIWLATGTPMENRLDELWNVMQNAYLGHVFAPTKGASEGECRGAFDIDSIFPGRIAQRLRDSGVFLRRERADVLPDLPDKRIERLEVELDPETKKLADAIVHGLLVAGVDIHTATLDAIETATMEKIPREMMARLRAQIAAAKTPVVLDLVADLEEAGTPVAVFSDHLATLRLLATRKGWYKVTGDENDEERAAAVEAIGKEGGRGIALSIRAAGTGTDGVQKRVWRGIFIDLPWNPQKLAQAEDRLVRIGQKSNKALFTRLIAAHVLERRIETLLAEKLALFDGTITAAATPGRRV